MKKLIKKVVRTIIQNSTALASSTKVGRIVNEVLISDVMNRIHTVEHQGINMNFNVPNTLNRFRAESFSTK